MEAELTTLDTATVEADWLRRLLNDLPVVEKPVPGVLMNCDNQTIITIVSSSKDNIKSSRHVQRRLKSVRKMRNSGLLHRIISNCLKIWQILLLRVYHIT